jgi:hypothetical protein
MKSKPRTHAGEPILPRHPRWDEFIERLAGPEGCDFQNDQWTCSGELELTKRILREMGLEESSIDVSASYFKDHSAYCDCEVVINIGRAR